MDILVALGGLGLLLLCGLALHAHIGALRRLLLPASVIAGFVGLALGPYALDIVPSPTTAVWATLPGLLINFVFAALFLGAVIPKASALAGTAGPLIRFSALSAVGQYAVGFALTLGVLGPLFGVPDLFACILEVGFSGGHGTAAAMSSVFEDLGFEAGGALGQMSATVGIVVAVVTGIALVQRGIRRGHIQYVDAARAAGPAIAPTRLAEEERVAQSIATVRPGVMDTFTLHVAVTAVAVLVGWVLLQALRATHSAFSSFPLFPLAMIGGILVQLAAARLGATHYFDRATFQRIMGIALDLLIVAAIATLRLDLFLGNVLPFALLMITGIGWMAFVFIVLAPRMLPKDWFEQAVVVYGGQTGVTAIGLMLLRIVDPQNRTTGAQAFAASSIVVSPLLGGGLVTATVPFLVDGFGLLAMLGACGVIIAALYAWARWRMEI